MLWSGYIKKFTILHRKQGKGFRKAFFWKSESHKKERFLVNGSEVYPCRETFSHCTGRPTIIIEPIMDIQIQTVHKNWFPVAQWLWNLFFLFYYRTMCAAHIDEQYNFLLLYWNSQWKKLRRYTATIQLSMFAEFVTSAIFHGLQL